MEGGTRRTPRGRNQGGPALTLLLLDTTLLIDAERGRADLDALLEDDDDVAVAAITVAELLVGVTRAKGQRRLARQAFVDDVIRDVPALPYDLRVAEHHARLLATVQEAGRPRGAHDLIIAATAVTSGRTIVTADATGFADLPGVALRRN